MAAIDSSGLESRHVSTYFGQRCGRRIRRFPKVSVVIDVASHLCLAIDVRRGPLPDDIGFHRLVAEAHARLAFDTLLADVGYDGEHHHRFLRRALNVFGVMPPTRGRPPHRPGHRPPSFYRGFLHDHWPALKKAIYGQRWQVETVFSMVKRRLGSAVRARRRHSLDREIYLRFITFNLMIIRREGMTFQRSKPPSVFLGAPKALSG